MTGDYNCPKCGYGLIPLYLIYQNTPPNTNDFYFTWVGYDKKELYGYWCEKCFKMYAAKTKVFIEEFHTSVEKVTEEVE